MAWARALATGRRCSDASATAALSMMRLPTISSTSESTSTGIARHFGDAPGELLLFGYGSARALRLNVVGLHREVAFTECTM